MAFTFPTIDNLDIIFLVTLFVKVQAQLITYPRFMVLFDLMKFLYAILTLTVFWIIDYFVMIPAHQNKIAVGVFLFQWN